MVLMEVQALQRPNAKQVQIKHQRENRNELTTKGKTQPVGGYVVYVWVQTLQRENKNRAWCVPSVVVTNNQAQIPEDRKAPLARPPTV